MRNDFLERGMIAQVIAGMILVALVALWAIYKLHRVPIPKYEKLADCNSTNFAFPLTISYHRPHSFVLGLPSSSTSSWQLTFNGQILLHQTTGLVARIPITSDSIHPCNWLQNHGGLNGYILTWGITNRDQRLDNLLLKGQRYDVQVLFSEPPPRGSSLWLASDGKVGEP